MMAARLGGVLLLFMFGCSGPGASGGAKPELEAQVPGSKGGNGFDDVRYSAALHKVLLGAGSAGLALVDSETGEGQSVSGLSGPYSADEGDGWVFVADRGTNELALVDPSARTVVSKLKLTATPDYVRYFAAKREVWITMPGSARIDVFSLSTATPPELSQAASIGVGNGPEGLAFGPEEKRAYFHRGDGKLGVIDTEARAVSTTWSMGCSSVHGIPIVDEARKLVFAGCGSAEVVVLSTETGEVRGRFKTEGGATVLGYSQSLHHFYLRADPGVPVTLLAVSPEGALSKLGTADATMRGHCMTADDQGRFWVCDEVNGKLLRFKDPFPATP